MNKPDLRSEWETMEREINERGGHLGGCWLPATMGSYTPDLCRWLVTWFNIRNVLDFCAGGGECSRQFRMLGCSVIALEGLEYAARRTGVPTITHDMEQGPIKLSNLDLAFSIEGVEHIANTNATLDTLCQAKVLAFSHAIPGQAGHHHVSCYDDAWWIERVEQRGYTYFDSLTKIARPLGGGYFGMSGLIFVRNSNLDEYGLLRGDYA